MTDGNDATRRSLRLKYNAALAAHQGCLRAFTEASMAGSAPSIALVENEAKAREELDLARERLLAAMTEAITGQVAGDPAAIPPANHVENSPPDGAS